jgi:heme A synthase
MFKNQKTFTKFAWFYLVYNIYVIIGGAYVRATGSGAGCGIHWPLCKGELIPKFAFLNTIIEFTHRASSGIVSIGALMLVFWAFQCFPKKHLVRNSSLFVLFFILVEALLGASLVLLSLVEKNSTELRAIMMALHLITTFMLLASISLTAFWASLGSKIKLIFSAKELIPCGSITVALIFVGCTGAITALSDTLFPPMYVGEGLLSDLTFKGHFLKSIRVVHPIIAIFVSIFLISQCYKLKDKITNYYFKEKGQTFFKWIFGLTTIQFFMGITNIILLTPLWTQMTHLFLADLIWILSILFLSLLIFIPTEKN